MAFITAHRKSGIGFFLLIYRNSFYKFHMMHGRQDWIKLIVSLLVCQLTGVIGSVFTRTAISQWYVLLEKPFFTPPSGLFAPVWIILYMLMGLALFFVWREGIDNRYAKHTVVFFWWAIDPERPMVCLVFWSQVTVGGAGRHPSFLDIHCYHNLSFL